MPRFNILFSIFHTLSSQFYIPYMGTECLPAVKKRTKKPQSVTVVKIILLKRRFLSQHMAG
ncbi:hypothetical protein HMPREF1548_05943 [Clostridium sp. KLE 1755]|nr:hypothetical protein HMPREF1548_05943 [Clostridium sp. KLE 1755]